MCNYGKIAEQRSVESKKRRLVLIRAPNELRRVIVHVETLHILSSQSLRRAEVPGQDASYGSSTCTRYSLQGAYVAPVHGHCEESVERQLLY